MSSGFPCFLVRQKERNGLGETLDWMLAAKHADVRPALVRIEVKAVKQNRISSNVLVTTSSIWSKIPIHLPTPPEGRPWTITLRRRPDSSAFVDFEH